MGQSIMKGDRLRVKTPCLNVWVIAWKRAIQFYRLEIMFHSEDSKE